MPNEVIYNKIFLLIFTFLFSFLNKRKQIVFHGYRNHFEQIRSGFNLCI